MYLLNFMNGKLIYESLNNGLTNYYVYILSMLKLTLKNYFSTIFTQILLFWKGGSKDHNLMFITGYFLSAVEKGGKTTEMPDMNVQTEKAMELRKIQSGTNTEYNKGLKYFNKTGKQEAE